MAAEPWPIPSVRQMRLAVVQRCQAASRLRFQLTLDDFLALEGPTGVAISRDDTRSNFFYHLGLSRRNYLHRRLYHKMKQEARAGAERLYDAGKPTSSGGILKHSMLSPHDLDPRYERAFRREVCQIFSLASVETRGVYELVKIRPHDEDNWVIRWLLYRAIQATQTHELSSTTSGAETEISIPSLTSAQTDSSAGFSVRNLSSPHWPMNEVMMDDEETDSDAWEEPAPKRPKRQHSCPSATTPSKSAFWSHVLT